MTNPVANPELLRSLGRLVRGLSALFWGLPLSLVVCVETMKTDWLSSYKVFPPLIVTGLLLFGLWQLSSFQKQERPWRSALNRAELFALINFGLSPFLYFWNQVPGQIFFAFSVCALGISGLLFLLTLNVVLLRLGAMLPDENLRVEIKQYSGLNRTLLTILLAMVVSLVLILQFAPVRFPARVADLFSMQVAIPAFGVQFDAVWVLWTVGCLLVLLPMAMTMALIWKTKEVILENVFGTSQS